MKSDQSAAIVIVIAIAIDDVIDSDYDGDSDNNYHCCSALISIL